MQAEKIGLWLVGARGGVAATVAAGLAALRGGGATDTGLVTQLPEFQECGLTPHDSWVLGGHEIRGGTLTEAVKRLEAQQGAIPPGTADAQAEALDAIDRRIRPGVVFRSGPAIDAFAEDDSVFEASTPREAIDRIARDLREFAENEKLRRVVVALLQSTEPPIDEHSLPTTWGAMAPLLLEPQECPLRASSLYAIAAMESGMPVVNFTPSLGPCCSAIDELARRQQVPYAGSDGKTGETLLKSVLAPMFAARRLEVMSWVGHNLLGNRDGRVLADPEHKRSKVDNKGALLERILGEQVGDQAPQSLVSIESIESLGDWKTAWNHVHFRGFLGVPMTLQFTWQGCDSALAAPLVIDLARLVEFAMRREESGPLTQLGAFFKHPLGNGPHDLASQMDRLIAWARVAKG